MNCHACSEPMLTDDHGHPTHSGPCKGYPVPWTEDFITCEHCGGVLLRKGLGNHRRACSAEHPQVIQYRERRCTVCSTYHRPKCQRDRAPWPAAPLVAALWERVPERTYDAAERILGFGRHEYPRPDDLLSDEQADKWACRVGLHASLIWGPEWFDAAHDPLNEAFMESGWRTAWLHNESQEIPYSDQEAAA